MAKMKSKLQSHASANLYCKADIALLPNLRALLDAISQRTVLDIENCRQLQDAFGALVRSGEVEDVIRNEVQLLVGDPRHVPSGSSGATLLLAESPMMALTVTILEERHAESPTIYSPIGNGLLGNLGPAEFDYALHRRPEGADVKVFDPDQKLELRAPASLPVGDTLLLSASSDVLEYRCTGPSLVLKLTARQSQQLIWTYDKRTGTPTMASAGNLHSSRVQMMLRTLAALEAQPGRDVTDPRSTATVEALCAHDFHFVRWGAVQTLCNMDFERGKQALLKAAHDPHPHIAAAASSSVAKLRQQGLMA